MKKNTDKIKNITFHVPIFHNLMDALLRATPKPDIFYLQMCSIKFDSQNIKDIEREILTAFFAIRKDPRLRQLRMLYKLHQMCLPNSLTSLHYLIFGIFL
ncbi:hypothetical protein G6Z86_07195 (plasmid) [Lactobacillus iners]|uniref:hypothetical protein n=1 Tax=Lactobacillus iners TaxID=147802 RepID=UPI0013E1CE4C|nr:hypothetical protein [Lactobacillus iners]QIH28351.1 hypothetical protein G6Z86_07195 [Lactobacillus iners]